MLRHTNSAKVLIVGGGLGGLVLAVMLERAGVDYLVLEQSVLIRPIGCVIALSPLVLPLMEQLGLLESIQRLSKPFGGLTFLRDDMSVIGKVFCHGKRFDFKERYGHYDQTIPRPDLYNILLSQIPKERIHLGKRLVNFHQHSTASNSHSTDPALSSPLAHSNPSTPEFSQHHPSQPSQQQTFQPSITVRCSDGTFYYGQVLVGADGATSAVRQSLYRQMKAEGILPKADQEEQQYHQVCLVGVTNPLSPKRYPDLASEFSTFKVVLNRNSPYMSWFMPIPGNRYCWLVARTLEEPVAIHSGNLNYSDWGPDATDEMSKAVRHLVGPESGTVGDLIDSTDRHLISKVMLEERHYKTWYHGRVVLMGDACHKSVPWTGKGASESMLDAGILASLLYDLGSGPYQDKDLANVFRTYYQTRSQASKQVIEVSSQFGQLLVKDGFGADMMRKVAFGLHSTWMGKAQMDRMMHYRIQVSFLPPVPDRGSSPRKVPVKAKKGYVAGSSVSGQSGSEDGSWGENGRESSIKSSIRGGYGPESIRGSVEAYEDEGYDYDYDYDRGSQHTTMNHHYPQLQHYQSWESSSSRTRVQSSDKHLRVDGFHTDSLPMTL